MSDLQLRLAHPRHVAGAHPRRPLGQQLAAAGKITLTELASALERQRRLDAPLGEILVADRRVARHEVIEALARQYGATPVDLDRDPPAPELAAALSADFCLEHHIVPWRKLGNLLFIATSRPDLFQRVKGVLEGSGVTPLPVIAPKPQIYTQINRLHGTELARRAITRTPDALSCRDWPLARLPVARLWARRVAYVLGGLAIFVAAPEWTVTAALLIAVGTLMMTTALKLAAFCAQLWAAARGAPLTLDDAPIDAPPKTLRQPRVSVLVPLLHEEDITGALIQRLKRLTYPKALLDVVLVLEAKDRITRATLDATDLPDWMSVIEVPDDGTITTKPRALNYALDFCNGQIVGVWDAEDAPAPDQIEKVVARFHAAPPEVVCLQGVLDYYNSRQNWISRCFTIEYATWFRLVLPGLQRLGFVIPLGGTTLFVRREALESIGRWDAHNVTEDADLGVRIARAGYRTELLSTVTHEEANCRAWSWVRQRSRWLKGFMVTWRVAMRNPRTLLRELGIKRVLGLQVIFLATVTQFVSLPLLWTFWLPLFGAPHPLTATLGTDAVRAVATLFIASETLGILLAAVAVSRREHRHLLPFVLTMPLYFSMAALASLKALRELARRPFFWDKTAHGINTATQTRGAEGLPERR